MEQESSNNEFENVKKESDLKVDKESDTKMENEDEDDEEHARKIFVGGLLQRTNEENLEDYFSKWGDVDNVKLMRDPGTGKSRGFAFITMKKESQLEACLRQKEPHTINGKIVEPKRAIPKEVGVNTCSTCVVIILPMILFCFFDVHF